jgi:hypothetical protein
VLIVQPNGDVTALYSDELRELGGTMHVERASDVEWDNNAQGWIATIHGDYFPPCTRLGPFATREEALAAEVAFIQSRL